MAELRRHPIYGEWVVVCPEREGYFSDRCLTPCTYCRGGEERRGVEIYAAPAPRGSGDGGGMVRVVAGSPPLFQIEGDLGKRAVGMCDCMESVGAHEIVIESPSHEADLDSIDAERLSGIFNVIRLRSADLARDKRFHHVGVFKLNHCDHTGNRVHPVWDIVATPFIPRAIKDELRGAKQYFLHKERCAFCDYIRQEAAAKERVIIHDQHTIAILPYAARFPFEIWLMPLAHSPDFNSCSAAESITMARALKKVIRALKQLENYKGYIVSIHTAPTRRKKLGAWQTIEQDYHWHLEIKPLLDGLDGIREAVGFHMKPMPSEEAARLLRACLEPAES
jgi:UDPglucose--hexose-1-phosphate uridylyltransferase